MIDQTFAVPGLTSGGAQYVRAVADAAFAIPGVSAVGIDRAGATLTVSSSRPIDVAEFSAAIDEVTDLKGAWSAERDAARVARTRGDRAAEWRHLERAHILSQPKALLHVRT